MKSLEQIPGLRVTRQDGIVSEILFTADANRETVGGILANLSSASTLWFYDSKKEAISDPGVFVTFSKHDEKWIVKFSNHGWSTNWVEMSEQELNAYLWACRHDNHEDFERFYGNSGMRLSRQVNPRKRVVTSSNAMIEEHVLRRGSEET